MTTVDPEKASVTIVRAEAIDKAVRESGRGRATLYDFAGLGGPKTWIGAVTLKPRMRIGAHHHGRHEVAAYVIKGRGQIRWGNQLEFTAEIGAGDFIYFAPYAPHEEFNSDPSESLDFIVIRSGNEPLIETLDVIAVANPTQVV